MTQVRTEMWRVGTGHTSVFISDSFLVIAAVDVFIQEKTSVLLLQESERAQRGKS